MFKTRMLLVGFALFNVLIFVLGIQGFIYTTNTITQNPSWMTHVLAIISFAATVVPPFAFTGSLVMLFLLFFNLQTTADGRLTYNPQNYCWKTLEKMYNIDCGSSVSLCKACWMATLTAFLFFVGALVIFITCIVVYLMVEYGINWDVVKNIGKALAFFATLISYFAFLCLLLKISENKKVMAWKTWLCLISALGSLFLVLVILPIMMMMNNNGVALFPAVLDYLKNVGMFIGMIVGVVLVVFLFRSVFIFLANLSSDNLFKRFFLIAKDRICPVLVRSENNTPN